LFERGEEAKKLYGPGRGIGLSIAVEFIKAHGGKVWAESQGQGLEPLFLIIPNIVPRFLIRPFFGEQDFLLEVQRF